MTPIQLEPLLNAISPEAPSGENLEYSAEFAELERAALGKPEQRMGTAVIAAEPPDWSVVLERGTALLHRTKDLRVAVYCARAALERGGFLGLQSGLALARGLLEKFWPTIFPQLDAEEADEPTMRISALSALSAAALIASVRAQPLLRAGGLGTASLKEIQAVAAGGGGAAGENGARPATAAAAGLNLDALLRGANQAELTATANALQQSLDHLKAIGTVFEAHTGDRGPDLSALQTLLREAHHLLAPRLDTMASPSFGDPSASALQPQSLEAQPRAAPAVRRANEEVASREDVLRALDTICAYYARVEPASPIPLLLQRCKRLVPMAFIDILKELAPAGMPQIELIAGKN